MSEILREQWLALKTALLFLTTLPVPGMISPSPRDQGNSLPWYPLVGLLIGGLLVLFCHWLVVPFYVEAVLVLVAWVALTGALHLDGLADCADAWLGGLGDRKRTLELLKDPLCGAMAVVTLVMVLMLKAAAIAAVVHAGMTGYLLLVPALARGSVLILFRSTAYVRPGGIGDASSQAFVHGPAYGALLALVVACFSLLPSNLALGLLVISIVVCVLVRRAAVSRLGGFTGDVAGAQIELVELAALLVLVAGL